MIINKILKCLLVSMFISTCLATTPLDARDIQKKLEALEIASGGRIGIFAINMADNTLLQYRANERFPQCSTGKVMGVAAILKKSMADSRLLQKKITYTKAEVESSGYAPTTENFINEGMTISELCKAAITQSDNTAMNLIMKQMGGPKQVTLFARSIGDPFFRLDRYEPDLNTVTPGDLRDTTTPMAMAKSLKELAFGNALGFHQKNQLIEWLKNNTTGDNRIRAGAPKGWFVGDKTGTGAYGTTNDIGIIWPTQGSPIVLVVYFTQNKKEAIPKDEVIASVTRIVTRSLKIA